jgi:hypothetical protein
MAVLSPKEGAREWSPLSAYPADSYQACLDGAKAHVETQVEGYTAENRSVMRYSRGGRETVAADLKPKGDIGKDSGQKLMDVSYRSATGPCSPLWTRQRVLHGPCTAQPIDIIGAGVFTKPLAPSRV